MEVAPRLLKKDEGNTKVEEQKITMTQEAAPSDPMEILAETTVVARRLWKRVVAAMEEAMTLALKLRQRTAKPAVEGDEGGEHGYHLRRLLVRNGIVC
jgi:hypothetical protein